MKHPLHIPKKAQIRTLILAGTLLAAGLGLYLGRHALLQYAADKKIAALESRYKLDIRYATLRMPGINQIELGGLTVVPKERDTLLTLRSLLIQLNLWELLKTNLSIQQVEADAPVLHFVKTQNRCNYDFLFKKNVPDHSAGSSSAPPNYSRQISRSLKLLFELLPHNGQIKNIHIRHSSENGTTSIHIPELTLRESCFTTQLLVNEDTIQQRWSAGVELDKERKTIAATLHHLRNEKITLPYLTKYYGTRIRFDTLAFRLSELAGRNGELTLQGDAGISGLELFHQALSPEPVRLNRGMIGYRIHAKKNFIELDSSSQVTFNRLQFHPYLRAEKREQWEVTAAVNKPWFAAEELFDSLPKGLFGNLDGLKTSGQLAYRFLLNIDFAQLDSLVLESELKSKNFRITQYGAGDLRKMSGEFLHTVYENGSALRTFPVGPSWEHFAPLDSIPVLLQTAILQSEDGGFFHHSGFLPDALREALIYDLKVNRFARGGSTISMQLIKNVFLTRHKNFARKGEEALLVWLIESQRLTSKERMFEVYLNIAEWGPMIYGIREAADFYFGKRPSQLTPAESIFLASIIPKPKHFRNSFTQEMHLKENLAEYYRIICSRLVVKGILTEEEAAGIRPEVELTGPARQYFQTNDSTLQDLP